MSTIFRRFPDEATFEALLPAGAVAMGETFDKMPEGVEALSVIGADATGYLVNALGTVPSAWSPYVISPLPGTPVRIFGG